MDTNLKIALRTICLELTQAIKIKFQQEPFGCCYLFGHCLAEGLSNAGLSAEEHSGHLILIDKGRKPVVYGTAKYRGQLIGYYHTWCVLKDGEEAIIIDPSLEYNKIAVKKHFGIKLDPSIPKILINTEANGGSYNYIEDKEMVRLSKAFLNKMNKEDILELTEVVTTAANALFED